MQRPKIRRWPQQEIPAEQLTMLKQRLGRIYIAEKKAIEQGLDKKPEVKLQMLLQHARVLAQKYAVDKLQEKMKATDEEVECLPCESSGTRHRQEESCERLRKF